MRNLLPGLSTMLAVAAATVAFAQAAEAQSRRGPGSGSRLSGAC